MKKVTYLFLLAAALGACTPKPSNKVEIIQPAAFVSIFPKGNAIEGTNFNGTAYLQRLMTDSGTFDVVVSDVYSGSGHAFSPYTQKTESNSKK